MNLFHDQSNARRGVILRNTSMVALWFFLLRRTTLHQGKTFCVRLSTLFQVKYKNIHYEEFDQIASHSVALSHKV